MSNVTYGKSRFFEVDSKEPGFHTEWEPSVSKNKWYQTYRNQLAHERRTATPASISSDDKKEPFPLIMALGPYSNSSGILVDRQRRSVHLALGFETHPTPTTGLIRRPVTN